MASLSQFFAAEAAKDGVSVEDWLRKQGEEAVRFHRDILQGKLKQLYADSTQSFITKGEATADEIAYLRRFYAESDYDEQTQSICVGHAIASKYCAEHPVVVGVPPFANDNVVEHERSHGLF